jgi:hypothetical protein
MKPVKFRTSDVEIVMKRMSWHPGKLCGSSVKQNNHKRFVSRQLDAEEIRTSYEKHRPGKTQIAEPYVKDMDVL